MNRAEEINRAIDAQLRPENLFVLRSVPFPIEAPKVPETAPILGPVWEVIGETIDEAAAGRVIEEFKKKDPRRSFWVVRSVSFVEGSR